jgi:hypothetical protein
MTTTAGSDPAWAPDACTLPTADRPLRLAEFDTLFTRHVRQVHRQDATRLVLGLTGGPEVAARAAELAARETGCCSFFTFDLRIADGTLTLTVGTGEAQAAVLAALADRAETLAGAGA